MIDPAPVFAAFGETLLRDLRQPEYIHVLLNSLPTYGLAMGLLGLVVAFFLRSHRARIATLVIVIVSAGSAFPVYEYGEQAYDRVLTMTDDPGEAWLDEHRDRAEDLIWFFYALAMLALVATVAPLKWPRLSGPLVIAVILLGAVTLGIGGYIAYAGGKIRHREFRNVPPPPKKSESQRESATESR
jgi:disulfide bond formation protein DsbB